MTIHENNHGKTATEPPTEDFRNITKITLQPDGTGHFRGITKMSMYIHNNRITSQQYCALMAVVELATLSYFCESPIKAYELSSQSWQSHHQTTKC